MFRAIVLCVVVFLAGCVSHTASRKQHHVGFDPLGSPQWHYYMWKQ